MNGLGLLYLALAGYALAAVFAGIARSRRQGRWLSVISIAASALGLCLQLAFTVARTISVGFLPFASRFESMALFACAVQVVGLVVYLATRQSSVKAGTDGFSILLLVGALVRAGSESSGSLNPILNSPWFAFHILVSFGGYACFTVGLIWSFAFLCDRLLDFDSSVRYRLAVTGLLLLGAGILTGAMWADSSWGTYWGWDPKESWALLTWALAMTGLHLRWFDRRWLAVLGHGLVFATMMFTFVGINLLKWGLHRY